MKYEVSVTEMSSNLNDQALRKSQIFYSFKKAYNYYCILCDDLNLDNADYSNSVEMEHAAGGIGYEYRVELLISEDSLTDEG